jgi:hypothetical protein
VADEVKNIVEYLLSLNFKTTIYATILIYFYKCPETINSATKCFYVYLYRQYVLFLEKRKLKKLLDEAIENNCLERFQKFHEKKSDLIAEQELKEFKNTYVEEKLEKILNLSNKDLLKKLLSLKYYDVDFKFLGKILLKYLYPTWCDLLKNKYEITQEIKFNKLSQVKSLEDFKKFCLSEENNDIQGVLDNMALFDFDTFKSNFNKNFDNTQEKSQCMLLIIESSRIFVSKLEDENLSKRDKLFFYLNTVIFVIYFFRYHKSVKYNDLIVS